MLTRSVCPQLQTSKHSRSVRPVSAIAAPVAAPDLSDPEERERLAKEYGFEKIGAPVPEGVTLRQVQNSLPPEVSLATDSLKN